MSASSEGSGKLRLRGRWVIVILVVSLLLNVFVLASFLGHKARGHKCGRGDGVREFVHRNPDVKEIAERLRRELRRENRDAFGQKRRTLHAAQAAYVASLKATPFDAADFAAKQEAFITAREAMRATRQDWMRGLVAALSTEQREKLAQHLAKQAECRRKHWDRRIKRFEKDLAKER